MEKEQIDEIMDAKLALGFEHLKKLQQCWLLDSENKTMTNFNALSKSLLACVHNLTTDLAILKVALRSEQLNNCELRSAMGHLQGMFYRLPLDQDFLNRGDA